MTITDDRENQGEPISVPPPVTTTETEFPFHKLGWDRFERLCQEIAQADEFKNVDRCGKLGQAQHGVDFTGVSPIGVWTAFQVKRKEKLTAGELETAVRNYAKGKTESPVVSRTCVFIVCLSIEANEQKLQEKLAVLNEQCPFPIEIWDAVKLTRVLLLRNQRSLVHRYFGDAWVIKFFGTPRRRLEPMVSEALRIGPIEAFGLTEKVEEADRLMQTSPEEASEIYGEVAAELRERFPGYANHFDLLRTKSLKDAGKEDASHDALMELAIRNLVEQAEPQLFPGVASALRDLHDDVDETRQARAEAVRFFDDWCERPHVLKYIAQCFDALGPEDEYAPAIAMLFAEAAVADCEFGVVLDRVDCLQRASTQGNRQTYLRINLALADAGADGKGKELIHQAELSELPPQENSYVLLRAARRSMWKDNLTCAKRQYRAALKWASDADLDLDVEKALWSLQALSTIRTYQAVTIDLLRENAETNQLALAIQGSRSYVPLNSRTRERALMHLANDRKPDAHLWIRFRLIESIRSGSLMDEFDSRKHLARLYDQSNEPIAALEQGLLGDDHKQVKDISSNLEVWPDYLADMVSSPALWVRRGALTALEQLGDLAPVQTARELAYVIIEQLCAGEMVQATIQALKAVVLEADESALEQLMPVLERFAPRKPNTYKLTDQGVSVVAARLYRFRPAFRKRAASVLAEMVVSSNSQLEGVLDDCGNDLDELIDAFERVAKREGCDLARPLSQLGHLNTTTRVLWSNRLQFVEQYSLDKRSSYGIGTRYDISRQFLEEQGDEVVNRYVRKLVAIGSNFHEPRMNRSNALASAFRVVEVLSVDRKAEIFGVVKPLIDPDARVSTLDEFESGTQHPLSRFQFSSATEDNVRAKALAVLARSVVETDARSDVVETALQWLGEESTVLQGAGATALLVLSHTSSNPDVWFECLANHSNHMVRGTAVDLLPNMHQRPEPAVLDRLASDPNKGVRIRVVYALVWLRDADPDAYERIGLLLSGDQSGVVRALATEALGATNQQGA